GNVNKLQELVVKNKVWVDFYGADGQSALMKAAQVGQEASLRQLLDLEAQVNLQDVKGNSALHHLAYSLDEKSAGALKVLVAAGANLQLKNKRGLTPFEVAMMTFNFKGML